MIEKDSLCGLCGLAPTTLRDWIRGGVVTPTVAGGKGRGNAARFDLMRAVGVAVAAEAHRGTRGCVPSYVTLVVEAFAATSEDELCERFDEGRTHFVGFAGVGDGTPALQGRKHSHVYDWPDVEAIYRRVKAMVAGADEALTSNH